MSWLQTLHPARGSASGSRLQHYGDTWIEVKGSCRNLYLEVRESRCLLGGEVHACLSPPVTHTFLPFALKPCLSKHELRSHICRLIPGSFTHPCPTLGRLPSLSLLLTPLLGHGDGSSSADLRGRHEREMTCLGYCLAQASVWWWVCERGRPSSFRNSSYL